MDPRGAILGGAAAIVIAFGGFGTWAALAPLASAVVAPGTVVVDSSRKQIQHLEGGIVKELLVRDGDAVEAGQVLIRLDETRARASLAILRGNLGATRAVEARLLAERDGADAVAFPEDLLTRRDEPEIAEALRGQEALFEARRASREGEISILEQQVGQLREEITGLEAQQRAKKQQIELIADELKDLKDLLAKGLTQRARVLALEREAARLEGERGEHIAAIARAKTQIGETKLRILQLEKGFREEVVDELRQTQTEIFDLKERVSAAQHVLDHVEVRAPESGVVVGLAAHTIGGVIQPGTTILEIVPVNDRLIVEARVRPLDIDNVAVGQDADVTFTAFKQRTTPRLEGRVRYVSADSLTDPRDGTPYYVARVEVPDAEVARLGEEQRLQPGMPADVMIKTGDRTAAEYLLQPLMDAVHKAWREE